MLDCFVVGAGGFVGAALRRLIGLIPVEMKSGFPVKTFAFETESLVENGGKAAAAAYSFLAMHLA